MAKDHVLPQAGLLDGFTQLDVVDNFQAQRFIGADGIVSGAADEIERANADVVAGIGVAHLPRTHGKTGHHLGKPDHHALTQGLHVRGGKKHKMVGGRGGGVVNRAAQAISLEDAIGVSE